MSQTTQYSSHENLSNLPDAELTRVIKDRLVEKLGVSKAEAETKAPKLCGYYRRIKAVPQKIETLDASLRVWTRLV